MSSNIPILLVGGGALAAGVYFLTKKKDPIVAARENRQRAVARGGPSLENANLPDPPLKGAKVAEGFTIERRGDWSKENPRFILSGEGAVFTNFDHRRTFRAPDNHPLWGADVCRGKGCVLYQPGPNPNAKYPSEFVETSKGIAAILSTVGQGVTGAFQAKTQFDIQKAQLKSGGGGGGGDQTAAIIAALNRQPKKSNTGLIAVVALGGLALAGMMFFMMNQGE